MKKAIAVTSCLVLVTLLLSCNLFKKNKNVNAPANEPAVQQPAQPSQSHAVPSQPTPQPKPEETATTNEPVNAPVTATTNEPANAPAVEEPVKKEKAGLGIIFVTNIKTGTLQVKVDKKRKIDHSFQRSGGFIHKELRFTKELKVKAGDRKIKIIVFDNKGSRGVKAIKMSFEPNSHHVLKVITKGAPGDTVVQIVE